MIYVFWSALIFLAYTFAGYPLLLWMLSLLHRRAHQRRPYWPAVSLIIVAHNEAKQIEPKILNTLEIKYPEDKREILIASDGSDDATADIIRSYADRGVTLIEIPERRGKHHAQMMARDMSHGEILIFSDASVRLESDVLQRMVSNFTDTSVGCVSSEDDLAATTSMIGEDSYVDFEMRLRRLESQVNSLVSLSGSFFAARREVCADWNPRQSSDFFLALNAVARGFRAVVDPECRGRYGLAPSKKAEFGRKVRTIVHGMDVFFTHMSCLNPRRFGLFSWQLLSHKLFRWLVPLALLSLASSSPFLWGAGLFYRLCLIGQVFLYVSGIVGLNSASLRHVKLLRLAGFFLMGNAAAAFAWAKYCAGERFTVWQPTQRE
jgi:cellulose synthase/poly-beta-1,6-N-acetylglucosamine synthase-like glycosyltransferase